MIAAFLWVLGPLHYLTARAISLRRIETIKASLKVCLLTLFVPDLRPKNKDTKTYLEYNFIKYLTIILSNILASFCECKFKIPKYFTMCITMQKKKNMVMKPSCCYSSIVRCWDEVKLQVRCNKASYLLTAYFPTFGNYSLVLFSTIHSQVQKKNSFGAKF